MLDLLVLCEDFFERLAGVRGHFVLELAELVRQIMQLGERQLGFVHDGVGGIEDGILREMADLGAFGDGDECRYRESLRR